MENNEENKRSEEFVRRYFIISGGGFEINKKELEELLEKYNYKEILTVLNEKGYLLNELLEHIKHFDKIKWL